MSSPSAARRRDGSRDIECGLAAGAVVWATTRVMDIGPFPRKREQPVAGQFNACGAYCVAPARLALSLR